MPPQTMFEKIWDAHLVHDEPEQPSIIYIDLHLVHEVTSAQAFDGLRMAGRRVRRTDLTVATADHNTPTCKNMKAGGPQAPPTLAASMAALGHEPTFGTCQRSVWNATVNRHSAPKVG